MLGENYMNTISLLNINAAEKEHYDVSHIIYNEITLHTKTRILNKKGIDIQLTKKEYQIMKVFMTNPDIPLSKEDIFYKVWDEDSVYDDKLLIIHIFRLKNKIGDNNGSSAYIRNIRGFGYIFGEK